MTPRGAKRHAAPTRRSEIQTLRQVARELFAPLSHPRKETPIHEGARAFSPLSFFFGGEQLRFRLLGIGACAEQGLRAPSRVCVCWRSEPEARLCGCAEGSVLLALGRAGARRAGGAGRDWGACRLRRRPPIRDRCAVWARGFFGKSLQEALISKNTIK